MNEHASEYKRTKDVDEHYILEIQIEANIVAKNVDRFLCCVLHFMYIYSCFFFIQSFLHISLYVF